MNNTTEIAPIVEVAVAVLQKPDGSFLLAQRPEGKIYAGFWEFPGGKIEPGETPLHALQRELHEELGIGIACAYPWLTRVYSYAHAKVRLNFFRVLSWQGEPHGKEGQRFCWQNPYDVSVSPLLPANEPILRALQLPALYAISNVSELGSTIFLQRLQLALQKGLRLVQLREKNLSRADMRQLSRQVIEMAHAYSARVLINADIGLAKEAGADGVHLNSDQLATLDARPDVSVCSASCHSAIELEQAGKLDLDFALLSPVLPTRSHPGAAHLGWDSFATIAANSLMPVYALGGLRHEDMETAWQHGAHGIALLRQAW